MLRDGIVCGLNNEMVQKKLLAERDLTCERANAMPLPLHKAQNRLTGT